MRIFKITGLFFLLYLLAMSGCSKAAPVWDHLYRADSTDACLEDISRDVSLSTDTEMKNEQEIKTEAAASVFVYICGAVAHPGVYELPDGARVHQVIEAAGGLREDADLLLVNQAKVVEDGEQIRIYTKEEASEAQSAANNGTTAKVNINTAGAETLMTLPGIGEAKAAAIIAYREQSGNFRSIDDIMKIPGIKEAVFSKIRDRITV